MTALLLQFIVSEKKLEAVQASCWVLQGLVGKLNGTTSLCKQSVLAANSLAPSLQHDSRTRHPSWVSWLSMCWRHALSCFRASS